MKDRFIHLNLDAVRATLARVYLTTGDKAKAAKYARLVIDSQRYKLTEKTQLEGDAAGWLSRNETIFGLYNAKLYATISPMLQQTISFTSLNPRSDIQTIYEDTKIAGVDFRFSAYFSATESGSASPYRLRRFTDTYELNGQGSSRPKDIVPGMSLIRLPEMYYIAAEALLATDMTQATTLFDEVGSKRGIEAIATWPVTTPLTPQVIDRERYKEMFGEGQDFFNKKRLGMSMLSIDGQTDIQMTKEVASVPIPDVEYENR